ncbi:MAG TPA: head-tail adaptor protein [Cyclobacteriaceae bacterium]|nr:head-tail adaptor protein [Cyclobacteriaceae bacterium]
MDIKLTFESPTVTRNSNGEDIITWSTFKTCYSERLIGPGNETVQANQQVSVSPNDYKIRYDPRILPTFRCYEGEDTGANAYQYLRDAQHYKREGYTTIKTEIRDNA